MKRRRGQALYERPVDEEWVQHAEVVATLRELDARCFAAEARVSVLENALKDIKALDTYLDGEVWTMDRDPVLAIIDRVMPPGAA